MDDAARADARSSASGSRTAPPRWGLRAHLLALVLAVLLPALALGGGTAWHMVQNYRRLFEERLTDTVRVLTLALDADIGAHLAALRALAASPDLDPDGDLQAFRRLAESALSEFGSWVVVVSADRRVQLLNTAVPPDVPLPPPREPPAAPLVDQAIATGEPTVINLYRGQVIGRATAAVVVPVVRDGQVVRLLGAPVLPERLSRILGAHDAARTGFATLLDGLGQVVARSADHERHVGSQAPGWFAPATEGRDRGLTKGAALDGQEMLIAYQRLGSAPSWTLAIGVPAAAYRASWLTPLLGLAAGGAAVFAFALALAAWLARRTLNPVRALVRYANAVAAGEEQPGAPSRLAAAPIAEFEMLRTAAERAQAALGRANAELRESEARFRALTDLAPSFIWFATPDGALHYLNDRWYEFTGQTPEQALPDGWAGALHPDDVAHTAAVWADARATTAVYEIEVRYRRRDGEYRWYLARAEPVRDEQGRVKAWFGSSTDIHDRKLAEGRQDLLMRELDHRAKNALAVVQAALRLTPKEDAGAYARAIEGRVAALARAHSMLAAARWEGAELHTLLSGELAPFLAGQRAELSGPRAELQASAAQSVAMAVHELATNAAKHGALSVPGGRISVSWRTMFRPDGSPSLQLVWTETGGPSVPGPPVRRGFGSRVLDATIRTQLGGSVELAWKPTGLVCTLEIPLKMSGGSRGAWAAAPGWAPATSG
jgi:PAS domain S-box-containing protein